MREPERRAYIISRLESAEFSEWSWVIVVAGVGFFTDAYSIFAINMVVPLLGIVYYGGTLPHNYETALSVVTLGGSILGEIGFGLAADLWGRRKMYGLELIITIGATLGVVMSSNGTQGSMSVIVWLLVWRFVLGIGIGADYPLSAVICAEFAPSRLRGRMLTLVFACQPVGQLAATLVTLIAVVRQRNSIPSDATPASCDSECIRTLDSIWRWVIGVGVIPAVIALWFRLTIIESPRYTADVGRDTLKAASELDRYLLSQEESIVASAISIQQAREMDHLTRQESVEVGSIGESDYEEPLDIDGHDVERVPTSEDKPPPEPSWQDFKQYFWYDGNLRTLIATSLCWFCVDLPFYGLGMNSSTIITRIWWGRDPSPATIYAGLIANVWQSLVIVSLGALIGVAVTFVAIDKLGRRTIQMIGFFWLFILFVVIGGSFNHLYEVKGQAAVVVLYILCQIFFNFGPNTITYIISAELFPTRYRGLCHGISAAFGKLGSVLAQLFLAYVKYGPDGYNYKNVQHWLPYSLLIFSSFMLCGLLMTIFWIPRAEHGPDGAVKTLEEWELGREKNGFAETRAARIFFRLYKGIAGKLDALYLWLDKMIGGDEAAQRQLIKQRTRMRELAQAGSALEH
ncbi:MFS general substrate transporter-58 [Coleophoma cylindrospora]|uniref:MFS general substrate transporter-58 n=1 Tax=Coleophoma cylindrospora TaxID=1849047 RepID=A0A3D8S8S3_9HELO|nr:MFS general substrate transporter-58 [Coleophoma cylindrospora]